MARRGPALVLVLVLLAAGGTTCLAHTPVVLMHGINKSAQDFELVGAWLREALPGIHVLNVEVGDGRWDSIFWQMDAQLAAFRDQARARALLNHDPGALSAWQVLADPALRYGFNVIAHSQGGLIARGYVQRFNDPPVRTLVTWSAPHAGQFGIPYTNVSWLDELIARVPYERAVQGLAGFAQYWNDPLAHTLFLDASMYLADLNNERAAKNTTYRDNLASLERLCLVYSTVDRVVQPAESGLFSFWGYTDGGALELVHFRDRALYREDWVGLRALDEAGRLVTHAVAIAHNDYFRPAGRAAFDNTTLPLLR